MAWRLSKVEEQKELLVNCTPVCISSRSSCQKNPSFSQAFTKQSVFFCGQPNIDHDQLFEINSYSGISSGFPSSSK